MIRHVYPPNNRFLTGQLAAPTTRISAAKVASRAVKIKR